MDQLSSCYFCGAALDATLDEHPVVPSALHPGTDSQKTIVLCGTCQRKLDAVLDTVVDAVERNADGIVRDRQADADDGGASGDDLESTLGDDEAILSSLGEDDATDEEAAEASAMEFGDDREAAEESSESAADEGESAADDTDDESADDGPKEPKYTKSRGAGFRKEDEGPTSSRSLTGGAFDDDDDDASSRSTSKSTSSASSSSSGGSSSGSGGSSSSSGTSSGGSDGSTGGSGGSGGSSGGSSDSSSGSSESSGSGGSKPKRDVSMSRLENTKVMRLLENREFPVDKDEFVTVAANAYQISRDDCEKVLDLAVEHGLLREESGQLYGGDA
ncbi:hypothetical protein [Halosimplex salinum]|uniref:hypothetical protein n=1 Tax=Halosimplex salinum TaxID=1710538 RepID=UPI000F4625A2|nr:hypothetical protein [Halosimplex salinum]